VDRPQVCLWGPDGVRLAGSAAITEVRLLEHSDETVTTGLPDGLWTERPFRRDLRRSAKVVADFAEKTF